MRIILFTNKQTGEVECFSSLKPFYVCITFLINPRKMRTEDLISIAKDIFGDSIKIYLQVKAGAWWEQEFSYSPTIETEKVYGVTVEGGNSIDFTFKTTKKEDNIAKSFVTQYINKWKVKQLQYIDGQLIYPTKDQCINNLRNNNRVAKYYFYTTLYGIGFFCWFMSPKAFESTCTILANHLKEHNIPFTTEFSEAGWVFRFVINQDVEIHNQLLTNLNL